MKTTKSKLVMKTDTGLYVGGSTKDGVSLVNDISFAVDFSRHLFKGMKLKEMQKKLQNYSLRFVKVSFLETATVRTMKPQTLGDMDNMSMGDVPMGLPVSDKDSNVQK